MEDREKIVHFDQYCSKCENKDKKDTEEPCDTCLSYPTNTYSHKPINFKEKEKK